MPAAEIAVGGDDLSLNPDEPTYTSFRHVASILVPGDEPRSEAHRAKRHSHYRPGGHHRGQSHAWPVPGREVGRYSDELGHNIPQAMWDFLNLKGVVQQGER